MSAAPTFRRTNLGTERAEMDFHSIFQHFPLPAAHCDQQGLILQMNSAFEQVVNGKKGQSGILRVEEVVASDDHDATDRVLREVFEGIRCTAHIGKSSTTPGWTLWRLAGRNGQLSGAIVIADPDLESTSQDLLQAERWETVGRLTGGVVHDFNNLLTGVMLYSDLFLASLDTGERRLRHYAEEIRGAVAQASLLIRQLLAFARPKNTPSTQISLNQIAETTRSLLARLIGENIELELHLEPRLGLVEIDWAQAEQMLLNLILNARDALPEGGRIVVETSNCKLEHVSKGSTLMPAVGFVLLTVSDTGCGMDAATRQRLFEPFYTTKATGTGLGLTTTRSIVTENRGLIHVESEPGRGTRVMILLPQSSPISKPASNPPHLAVATLDSPRTTLQEIKKEPHL